MPRITVQPGLTAPLGLVSKADFDREAEEFNLRRQEQLATKLLTQMKLAQVKSGADLPATIQVANEIQQALQKGDTHRANLLAQVHKSVDRGVLPYDMIESTPAYNAREMGGYGSALGGIAAAKAGMEQQAKKDVDLQMNPRIAGEEAAARLQQEMTYQPELDYQVSISKGAADRQNQEMEKLPGKERLSGTLGKLRQYYDDLDAMGGLVDADKSPVDNVIARTRRSSAGQYVEGYLGTEQQREVGKIAQLRPALIADISKATGISSKSLDSNRELDFYLQQVTDPRSDRAAVYEAIDVLEQRYGLGGGEVDPLVLEELQAGEELPAAPQDTSLFGRSEAKFKASKAPRPKTYNRDTGEFE